GEGEDAHGDEHADRKVDEDERAHEEPGADPSVLAHVDGFGLRLFDLCLDEIGDEPREGAHKRDQRFIAAVSHVEPAYLLCFFEPDEDDFFVAAPRSLTSSRSSAVLFAVWIVESSFSPGVASEASVETTFFAPEASTWGTSEMRAFANPSTLATCFCTGSVFQIVSQPDLIC